MSLVRARHLRLRFAPAYLAAVLAIAVFEARPATLVIGAGLVALGVALRSWGAGHLVKREALTLSGPYAHLRHPLYAGTLAVCLGFATAVGGGWMWPLLAGNALWFFVAYFPRKERLESELLEARYGGAYTAYRARVPALWPALRAYAGPGGAAGTRAWRWRRYRENGEAGTALAVLAGVGLLALRASLA